MTSSKLTTNYQLLITNYSYLLVILLFVSFFLFGLVNSSFALSQPNSPPFSFVVFGDNQGAKDVFVDLINVVKREKGLDFCVDLGDSVNRPTQKEYQQYLGLISNLKIKVYHVPGNHDVYGKGEANFKKYFGPLYYSFDYQNSHFIVLNNAFKEYFTAEQFAWLKQDLASTRQEHIFVFMHRPTFDPTELYSGYVMSGRQVVAELLDLFSQYQVDYVFAGHIHGFATAKRAGVVYVVSGGAGGLLHLPRNFGGFYHYVKIAVSGKKIAAEVVKIYE